MTMKCSTKVKRIVAVILAVAIMTSALSVSAFAAEDKWGYGQKSTTFTVTTKSAWYYPGRESITFKNYKVEYTTKRFKFWGWKWVTETKKAYPTWEIKAVSTDGKHKVSTSMKGGSKKIRLKGNKTYRITVTYGSFNWADNGTVKGVPGWSVKGLWKATIN